MSEFRIKGAEKDEGFETIYATHPALPGTYLVYAFKDGAVHRVPVLLWGVVANGSLVPICFDGPWEGCEQANRFILYPDGKCAAFEQNWDNEEQAIEHTKKLDR